MFACLWLFIILATHVEQRTHINHLFDLEVFYFLVSIQKREGSPCSSLSDRTLFQCPNPLFFFFFFLDRTRPEKREERPPKSSNVPIVAALQGLATGVSVSALVLRLSLSLSTVYRSIFVSLSLSVRQLYATCLIYSPFVNIDFQNCVCIIDFKHGLVNVI